MSVIYLILGLIPSALSGWLLLDILQGTRRVLFRGEQWLAGTVTGLLSMSLLTFIAHVTLGMPLDLRGFASVQLGILLVLGIMRYIRPRPIGSPERAPSDPLSRTAIICFNILGIWIAIKLLTAGTVFLFLTPTYLDDTLDNWNLRAKVFYFDEALTLSMPSEDPEASKLGVSSYPPSVPLMKTWLATIARTWSESLINSIHVVWYIAAIGLLYYALRRIVSNAWSLTGAILLGSIPLYLMHGTNAYADIFVSVHVFLAVSMTLLGLRESDAISRMSFFRIGAVMSGLLPFTKNEGLIMYLPPLILILCAGLWFLHRTQRISMKDVLKTLSWYAGCIIILSLPWLIFKWSNGLTFGNAKSVSSVGFGWQKDILQAIWVNTFFEGNWLLLFPLLIILLIWRRAAAFRTYLPVTFYVLAVFLGQMALFLFTGLSAEARMQTGIARGVVQQLPIMIMLASLLLADAQDSILGGLKELGGKYKKVAE